MSTVLSISFIPRVSSDYPEIFCRLSNWIEKYSDSFCLKEIPDTANYKSNEVKSINPIDILSSSKAVVYDFLLTKYMPLEIRGSLWLYGHRYGDGQLARENGNVKFSIDERYIWGEYRRQNLESKEYEKAREHEISVLFEISEFFNDLVLTCESLINYASIYTESGIPTSFTSSAVFFKDLGDIAKDYQRVYIESRSGKSLLDFFGLKESNYEVGYRIINKAYYESFASDNDGNLLDFLESFGLEDAYALSKLENNWIEKNLKAVLLDNTDIIFYEIGSGYTLATYPLLGLWTLYRDLFNKLLPLSPPE